jgi:hypothetical protein
MSGWHYPLEDGNEEEKKTEKAGFQMFLLDADEEEEEVGENSIHRQLM